MELSIKEIPKPLLMGLKVNASTLLEKEVTVAGLAKLLNITENYVIGLDSELSNEGIPHYHIHFLYEGNLAAIRQLKQRKLKGFGKSTKLSQADQKEHSDPNCWLGYAIKETAIYVCPKLNRIEIDKHAHTQAEFKKSKLKWGAKKEKIKVDKKNTEEELFNKLDAYKGTFKIFNQYAAKISEIFLTESDIFLPSSRLEYYTWKYLLKRKIISHGCYVREKLRDFNIEEIY